MEFKGTKGNWEINPRASRNVRCGNVTIANCSAGQNGDDEEIEKANAKLIAAAPEMFEFIASLENDNNSIPKFMWDKRNELLKKITE